MSRRAAAVVLSQSPAVASFFATNCCFLSSQCPISISRHNPFKRPRLSLFSSGSSCSSPDDDLRELNDPGFLVPWDGGSHDRENRQEASVSMKDFTFLQEAAVEDRETLPGKPLDAGKSSKEAVLIAKVVRASGSNFDDNTEKILRRFRGNLNESLVIGVLRLVSIPDLALRFFIWAGQQIGYSHTGQTYDALIEILGFDKKSRVPQHFLREIGQEDREVLGRLLNVLVRKCCHSGFWNEALEELGRLKDFGYKPSKVTYNTLVQVHDGLFAHSLCKAGQWAEALNIIEAEDFTLDTVLCTQMISGLLEASLFEEAMSFLHRMRSNSCVPNVVTYRTLLSGFLRKKQLGKYGGKGFPSISGNETNDVVPDVYTYTILIDSFCKAGLIEQAWRWFKEMQRDGCLPNVVTYTALIHAYLKAKQLSKANELFKSMNSMGCVPNVVTYTALIDGLCKAREIEEACHIYAKMRGICEDAVGSNYFEGGSNEVAQPNVFTYGALVDGLCKAHKVVEARGLLDAMTSAGCESNHIVYDALIAGFARLASLMMHRRYLSECLRMGIEWHNEETSEGH
ncbi:PPR repeat [Musa troglodytarum]|uniref:PPR repeat n=1 Tax=Musa troglodytarum TaxID=320322 RepID=A0A9E7FY90_9LILI|nr:PPR repeat [Musa troglodytarum]URE05323.1 PPR repeat [Musa troglodytarum]URE05325.1 PPR repeat [Musa troglodytarum]URE05326.1 PPR repeat [Musa troglodytarum]